MHRRFKPLLTLIVAVLVTVACGSPESATESDGPTATAPLEPAPTGGQTVAQATPTDAPEPTFTSLPPTPEPTPTPTSTPAIVSEHDLADAVARLPGLPRPPQPGDAQVNEEFSSPLVFIEYTTEAGAEEVSRFYQAALPAQGWTVEHASSEDGQHFVRFAGGEGRLDLSAEPDETGDETLVSLTVGDRSMGEELSTLPMPEDAEMARFSESYFFTTGADLAQILSLYWDFFQTELDAQGWVPRGDYGSPDFQINEEFFGLEFWRGASYVSIHQDFSRDLSPEAEAENPLFYVDTELRYVPTASGYRYASGRSCFTPSGDLERNAARPPADFDLQGHAAGRVDAYASLVGQALEDDTLDLLCLPDEPGGTQATFAFLLDGDDLFYLDLIRQGDNVISWKLTRVNRATQEVVEQFEYHAGNLLRIVDADYVSEVDAAGLQVLERVFVPLIDHIESMSGPAGLREP